MSRNDSQAWFSINSFCEVADIGVDELYKKSKLLLEIYRDVCWKTVRRCDILKEEMSFYGGGQLDQALIYLEEFVPEGTKRNFAENIQSLFETSWLIELVDSTIVRVKDFPDGNGDIYFEILSKYYLSKFKYTEREMLDILNLERSRFYDRKKEAILLFGEILWGTSIPYFKDLMI